MHDKEKVELGIKACWSEYFSHKCFDCPYVSDRNDKKCVERLGTDAIALLKEQEAVEPNPVHNSSRWFACGKCDCSITREDRFCPRCGRRVKWE